MKLLPLGLLLFPLAAWAGDLPQAALSPPPGRYTSAVTVAASVPDGTTVLYRFLENPTQRNLSWNEPLTLDALPGESRAYTLRLTTQLPTGESVVRDFSYTVARPITAYPTIRPVPGTYTAKVELAPNLPQGWTLTVDGGPIQALDTADGTRATFAVEAKGPGGQSASWTYDIDKRDQAPSLDLVSPAAGTWANVQELVVSYTGFDRVLWSYGDHLDNSAAHEYSGPVLLDTGTKTVTVAGHTRDGGWIEKSVTWTSGDADLPPGWPAQGVRTEGADFPAAAGWSVSWDLGRSWQVLAHSEDAPPLSRKVLVVQARKDAVSRLVYWFEVRAPEPPRLRFEGGWNPRLLYSGSPAVYHVSWTTADGKKQDDSAAWGPLGSWKVPDGMVGATVRALAANGKSAESTVDFAETGWPVPRFEAWDQVSHPSSGPWLPLGGRVVPRPGFQAAYEVSSTPDVPEPGPASPLLDGAFLPSVPPGADRTFYVRFAWRDATGLTGPGSPVSAVRVDRLPPPLPDISGDPQITLSSTEDADLLWAATSERAVNADAVTFQPYSGPLDGSALRAGGAHWLQVRARDRAGNLGPARLNVALSGAGSGVVQVDPDPAVGETPIEDGGVYPWPQFRLRSDTAGLWVAAADARFGVPASWAAELQPWTGLFVRSGGGGRKNFLLFWNLKTADGWAWPQPKTLTLTLEQGPPAPPVTGTWPSVPQAQPWTLTMRPGQPGDTLRYSFTFDGSAPPDPVTSGLAWPGTKTWEAPEGVQTQLRVRVAAISASGKTVETPLASIAFDRRPAPAVTAPLETFTYRSAPFTVPGVSGTRYSLTSDGSIPPVPTLQSAVSEGMTLPGTIGQTVLYRFRWRAFTDAGEPGPVSDTYSVLIDRTQGSPAVEQTPAAAPVRVTGIPASGVSASPIVVAAAWTGELRYELQEGLGTPRVVTRGSPVWKDSLTLDGGDGIDRSYTLAIRGFSPDGRPLTDEIHYTARVDRASPGQPSFNADAGSRPDATLTRQDAAADEDLEYRWAWKSYPTGSGEGEWTRLTEPSAVFSAPHGELTWLTVQARLRDEAGNLGPVSEKTVLLDQGVVYLAPGAKGDGSRAAPAGTVTGAVDAARGAGKTVVFAAAGTYPVEHTVNLGGLEVYGGWSATQWEASRDGRAVWVQAPQFQGTALIQTESQDWSLTGVDLFSAGKLDSVVSVRGGAVSVSNSSWTWGGAGHGWLQESGTLSLNAVSAIYNAVPGGSFLSLVSVQTSLSGLNLAAGGNQEGLLFSCKDSAVTVNDLVVVSKNGTGYDGVWRSEGGSLSMSGARVLAGAGVARALAFRLQDSAVSITRLDLSLFGTAANTAFQMTGGSLDVDASTVSLLRGTEFNQGIVADHVRVSLSAFTLKIDSGSYQGGFNFDGGSLSLTGSVTIAGGGQQAWGGRFRGNTLVNLDATWTLAKKTPGQTWMLDAPWADGSVNKSTVQGW